MVFERKMSCLQIIGSQPHNFIPNQAKALRLPLRPCHLPLHADHQVKAFLKIIASASGARQVSSRRYQQKTPVCLFVGGGKLGADNEETPWKSLDKDMESSNMKMSIEDVLREQIEKKEYFKEGGKGNNPRGGGGGKGGGGGRKNGDGSGESDDKDFSRMISGSVQVVLATLGFIFVYVYIITGEELIRLLKDYIKFLSGGGKSARLIRAMDKWENFLQKLTEKKIVGDKYWLGKEVH